MNLLNDFNDSLWESKNVVYCYVNLINGKRYVGQTMQKLKTRHANHMYETKNSERKYGYYSHFHCAIRKYGLENFKLEIIHFAETLSELNYFEIFYIKYFNTTNRNLGYNTASGGSNGWSCAGKTEEELMEIRKKQSVALSGVNNPCYGRKGENHPAFGYKHTEEFREKQSESMIGEKNPMFGVCGSLHHSSKKIKQYDLNGKLIKIWSSIAEIERELGLAVGSISYACSGRLNTVNGFVWRYLEDSFSYNPKNIKKVCKFSKDGILIAIYDSIAEASKDNNLYATSISRCCIFEEMNYDKEKWFETHKTKPMKTSGGFIWKFYKDVN